MPRFYFRKVHGNSWIDDLEGTELNNVDAARMEAEARAAAEASRHKAGARIRVHVLDEAGNLLFIVRGQASAP
jgi:hypothetical protein